ncbi:MAG: extracellular solute-binding protein [Gammaproteobacteria bacterium]|nr:extracellular solute-binding protein [Gammaproteobacteria bacterium]
MCKSSLIPKAWRVSMLALLVVTSCGKNEATSVPASATTPPLILYSSLPETRVRAITMAYAESSGVAIEYMLDSQSVLIEKIVTKAHRPTADVLLISDVGELVAAVESDAFRPARTENIRKNIPAALRDPDDYWFGLATRAIAIVYDARSVDPETLTGYAALADEAWSERLCLLSSTAESSRTLVAFLMTVRGDREAELVVRRWRQNLARPVFSNGSDLLLAIESGDCEVGIVGSEAIAGLLSEQRAGHVALHWPSAADGGVLLNLTGAGVTRHAASPTKAVAFLEWLASTPGQQVLVDSAREYPANPRIEFAAPFDAWTEFDVSPVESVRLGYRLPEVARLVERARYR